MGSVEGGLALPRGATFGETWGVELGDGYQLQRTPSGASDRPPYSSGGGFGSCPCILLVNKGSSAAGGVCAVFLTRCPSPVSYPKAQLLNPILLSPSLRQAVPWGRAPGLTDGDTGHLAAFAVFYWLPASFRDAQPQGRFLSTHLQLS